VIGMGKSIKLRVVAEGVETCEQLDFLQTHGCDEGQGYYFSPPVVAEQFAELLKSGIGPNRRPLVLEPSSQLCGRYVFACKTSGKNREAFTGLE
jgi:predicted signal transduction protein with EAL and GGDEF domain